MFCSAQGINGQTMIKYVDMGLKLANATREGTY